MSYELELAGTQKEKLRNFVLSRRDKWRSIYNSDYKRLQTYYQLWRGIVRPQDMSHRNNVAIPLLYSYVAQSVSKKCQALMGTFPYVNFIGFGPEDSVICRKNDILVSSQWDDMDGYMKLMDFLLNSEIYGTGFMKLGWKFEERMFRWYERINDEELEQQEKIIDFDGPNIEVVDHIDMWPEPGKRRMADGSGVGHTYYTDFDTLWEETNTQYPKWDRAAVIELKMEGGAVEDAYASWKMRNSYTRNYIDYINRKDDIYAKPVKIDEYWGLVPEELAINGVRQVVISIANDSKVIRAKANPYWFRKPPFFEYTPMRDPGLGRGIGKAEIMAPLQAAINKIVSQKLDVLDLIVFPMFATLSGGFEGKENLAARPGRVLQINANSIQEGFAPITPDVRGTQQALEDIGLLSRYAQQGVGLVEDVGQGMSGNRTTAREWLGRAEVAAARSTSEVIIAEKMVMEPVSNAMRELNRQLLSVPRQLRMLGKNSVVDPVTGIPIPMDSIQITREDTNPDYRARARGSSQMIARSQKQQNLLAFSQWASSNPYTAQLMNWAAQLHYMAELFDLPANELLVNSNIPVVNQMAQMGGPQQLAESYVNGGMPQGGTELDEIAPEERPGPDFSSPMGMMG